MLLKNCRLIPQLSDDIPFSTADISIADGKIEKVRPASGTPPLSDEIDCHGMTVLPGLFDLHVHLYSEREPNDLYHAFQLYHRQAPLLNTFLDHGVTTIRDCGSTMQLACYLRDGVNQGLFDGPRIFACGHILSPEAMRHTGEGGAHFIANGVDEVTKAARYEFANGADFIKIYSTQSMSQVNGQDPKCIYSADEIIAMVAVARNHHSYVASHAHSTDAINTCIRCGVRSIEHATYMDEESIRLFSEHPDAYAVPTSAVAELYRDGDGYNPPEAVAFWSSPHMLASNKRSRALKRKAYLAGVKMGVGTDLHPETFAKYPYEFWVRRECCGMDNIDILIQATKISAEIAMVGNTLGQIREGYTADLIAVNGHPDEDISVMYQKPLLVIKDGVVKRQRSI